MSEPATETSHDRGERGEESMPYFRSAWMAHWRGANNNAKTQTLNLLQTTCLNKENDDGMKQHESLDALDTLPTIPRAARGELKIKSYESKKNNLTVTSRTTIDTKLTPLFLPQSSTAEQGRSASPFKCGSQDGNIQAFRPQADDHLEPVTGTHHTSGCYLPSVLPLASATAGTSSEHYCQTESKPLHQKVGVKTHQLFRDSGFSLARPVNENFKAPPSPIVPYRMGFSNCRCQTNRIGLPSLMDTSIMPSGDQLAATNFKLLEGAHCNYHEHSEVLVRKGKLDHLLDTGEICKHEMSVLPKHSSTRVTHSPVLGGEWMQKFQTSSSIRWFRSNSNSPEQTQSGKSDHGHFMLQNLQPSPLQDLETMRIRTSVGSVKRSRGGHPKISQTTSSFFITRKSDVNFASEFNVLGSTSTRLTEAVKESASTYFSNLSTPCHGYGGVKLQLLGSSTDSEAKDNADDVGPSLVLLKNESSAETDTMDMEALKETNQLSGASSFPDRKVRGDDQSLAVAVMHSHTTVNKGRRSSAELPDINLEVPASVDGASPIDDAEPSSSRTQTLDMALVAVQAEQHSDSKTDHLLGSPLRAEPSSRWVKRLKLKSSDSRAVGTKSSKDDEESTQQVVNKLCKKNLCDTKTSPEPTEEGECPGKRALDFNTPMSGQRARELSSSDSGEKPKDLLLSYSWIQRLLHNRAATSDKKPERKPGVKSQSSKLPLEDIHKKQFPSIAAMALMGKAMTGFQTCELQKRGNFVVWNSRSF